MDISISPSKLKGNIKIIPSKSYAHRYLIASALADSSCEIDISKFSEDIKATVGCIESLGATVSENIGSLNITPVKEKKDFAELFANESGTTARLLIPVASAIAGKTVITGCGRLPERPMGELCDVLRAHNVKLDADYLPITIEGKPDSGRFEIKGNISSQYISGLLFTLPLLDGDSEIILTTPLESKGYVDMTIEVMKNFGINVTKTENGFRVVKGKYISPKKISVEADWSNGAFFFIANQLGADIEIENLNLSSVQGDRMITDLLSSDEIDASQIPDLVPILCVLAASKNKTTKIYNAGRLRLKESDRISSVCSAINSIGGKLEERKDEIIIHGNGRLKGGISESFNDHRIVMSLAVASLICDEPVVIKNAEAVNKSYPQFFDEFKKLGGNINVLHYRK